MTGRSTGGAQGDQLVSLDELVAAARRYPGPNSGSRIQVQEDWVLVDPDDRVLAAFDAFPAARKELFKRIDKDHVSGLALRLVSVRAGRDPVVRWPDDTTPMERAVEAARQLNSDHRFSKHPNPVIASNFLRGEDRLLDSLHGWVDRVIELWWSDSNGERQIVGYLHEHPEGVWTLLHAYGADRPPPERTETHIAEAVNDTLDFEILQRQDIRKWRARLFSDESVGSELQEALIRLAVELAERLELLCVNGEELT